MIQEVIYTYNEVLFFNLSSGSKLKMLNDETIIFTLGIPRLSAYLPRSLWRKFR
ncbi:hypothetical protein BTN50_0858 [Candidatus Enterovibrio altilux]|uniref:Uncharacterized protein n=1 Tax=Candidatus Enterovibrio altilux TaxID=1927128 RepID=A0A291B8M9_9GAMM|nr:hypothetical protein BTN50_0858 [Candidatus Enterovibrio luxaltus]